MTVSKIKRKLTTIFCADVQNYSTLMASDEAETLQRLQRYRAIMGDLFERHDGRKVNTWGDAVIAEFSSVVEAVRCGIEIQDAIGDENRDLPAEKQMWFRIGINLGDVMQDGSDLYGDGVNVAARLESLADPGGIMVSRTVFDLTHKQLAVSFDFAGEQKVKGQDTPIAGFRVRMPGRNVNSVPAVGKDAADRQRAPAKDGRMAQMVGAHPPMDQAPASKRGLVARMGNRLQRFREWYRLQSWPVRASVFMIGMFATINLLTSGLSDIWFIYPSIPFAIYLLFHAFVRRA